MIKLTPLSRAAATVAAVLGACLLTWVSPVAAFAQSGTGTGTSTSTSGENTPLNLSPSSTATHSSSGGASIVRTIVGLAIVLAVIWGLTWILRQVKAGRDPQVSSAGLASVSALTLSTGRSVHLVRAGNEYVLLGSAEHGVVPIHRYTEEEAREAGLLAGDDAPVRPRRALLQRPPAAGEGRASVSGQGRAPASGEGRHDPMRMPSPQSGLIERVREWTVRR
jgi:flagellar protein FliO/FliZ